MVWRVALGGFLHETNSFAPRPADHAAFLRGDGYIPLVRGRALLDRAAGINLGISGALDHARAAGWEAVPLLWAGAIPSGRVTRDAFERIAGELVERLAAALPVDGVLLDLHGAMQCEHLDDGEGALLARVRAAIGPDAPIAAALDLHANVTAAMAEAADLLVGFRTYPHVDMAETGRRAAEGLAAMLGGARPARAFRRLPYLAPIPWQCTDIEPAAGLYRLAGELEADGASVSLLMGFPATDFPECGPTALAYAGTQAAADAAADRLADAYAESEPAFAGRAFTAADGVAEALRLAREGGGGPVILADTQDNPGAGGSSDTTGLLRALVASGAEDAAIGLIVDPEAAAAAHRAGTGATIRLALGGRSGIQGDAPFAADFSVEALSDGQVHATGPYYGGSRLALGPMACLRTGGVRIAVATNTVQMADRAFFRAVGIEPEATRLLGVKSSTHFRADFAPIASAILVVTAPGAMPLDPAALSWRRIDPAIRLSPLGPTRAELGAEAAAGSLPNNKTTNGERNP
jgi:microcystin degradation protein MlrC